MNTDQQPGRNDIFRTECNPYRLRIIFCSNKCLSVGRILTEIFNFFPPNATVKVSARVPSLMAGIFRSDRF